MINPLPRLSIGDVITAQYLNQVTGEINELQRFVPPKMLGQDKPTETSGETPSGGSATQSVTWDEWSRSEDLVRVTSPNDEEVYVDVDRIVSVTFKDGGGQEMTLNFSN